MDLVEVFNAVLGLGAACWTARICGQIWEGGGRGAPPGAVWVGTYLSALYFSAATLALLAGATSFVGVLPASYHKAQVALDVVLCAGPLVLLGWIVGINVLLGRISVQHQRGSGMGSVSIEGMVLVVMAALTADCGSPPAAFIVVRDFHAKPDGTGPAPTFCAAVLMQALCVVSVAGPGAPIAALLLMTCMTCGAIVGVAATAAISKANKGILVLQRHRLAW